ncbi:MAG TPA: protein kinase [Gemmataceae bacterium]|nr:protein kinase [Gemmataceae bacterium]
MIQESTGWVGLLLAGGRYRITDKLGEGGMGFVFRARDLRLDCDVVIKVPRRAMLEDAGFAGRFAREIRSLVQLAHPHIVKVTDVGEHEGLPFAVMQFLPGGSLRDRQRSDSNGQRLPVSPEALADWLPGVAAALDFIHERHYIHRDVKPDNILFDNHGHVYLSDFGIAKVVAEESANSRPTLHTGTGLVLGTPPYMAPELFMGEQCDGRVDQYALAVTIYELLSGRLPAEGPTPAAILVQKTTRQPAPLAKLVPSVPGSVSAAVQKALAREPSDRYSGCMAFAQAVLEGCAKIALAPAATPKAAPAARIACPHCQKVLTLSSALQGKRVRCPACGQSFQAPGERKTARAEYTPTVAERDPAVQAGLETPLAETRRPMLGGNQPGEPAEETDQFEAPNRIRYLVPAIALVAILGLACGAAIRFFGAKSSPPERRHEIAANVEPAILGEPPDPPRQHPVPEPTGPVPEPKSTETAPLRPTTPIRPNPTPPQQVAKSQLPPEAKPKKQPPLSKERSKLPSPEPPKTLLPKIPEKAAVPDAGEQSQAEKVIKDLYKPEYARQRPAELADKLFRRAQQSKTEQVENYVLLREARDLAAQGGNARLAFHIIEEMEKRYTIDALEMKADTLEACRRSASDLQCRVLAEMALGLIPEAVMDSNFDLAARLIHLGREAAKKSGVASVLARVDARDAEVKAHRREHERAEQARVTLQEQPDDAAANLLVGNYLCLVRGEWDEGLPLLARGNDPLLQSLAERDLALPVEANAQVEIGDGWWDKAEKETGLAKENLRGRAKFWYGQAVGRLSGLTKAKVEKRIGEAEKETTPTNTAVRPTSLAASKPIFLFDLTQLSLKSANPDRFNQGVVTVQGERHSKALSLHPPANGVSQVIYGLGRQYSVFKATVAIEDTPQKQPSVTPLTFAVLADGKLRWTSQRLQKSGQTQECRLNVRGVNTLTLLVQCRGPNNRAFAVWVDPYVSK